MVSNLEPRVAWTITRALIFSSTFSVYVPSSHFCGCHHLPIRFSLRPARRRVLTEDIQRKVAVVTVVPVKESSLLLSVEWHICGVTVENEFFKFLLLSVANE